MFVNDQAVATRKSKRFDVSRLRHCRLGSVAIEFAATAVLFFGMAFALFDIGLLTLAESLVGRSVNLAARETQIGSFGDPIAGESEFRERLCETTIGLFDCDAFHIFVQPVTDFASANAMVSADPVGQYSKSQKFDVGNANDIVIFRVMYPWSNLVIDPRLAGRLPIGDDTLLVATAVVRNEPAS